MASKRQLAERKATVTNFQFHPKRVYKEPESPREMTPEEMKIAEKNFREAGVWLYNLCGVVRDPSDEQADIIDGWIDDLANRLLDIRSKLG
jgi:hypothetical protein